MPDTQFDFPAPTISGQLITVSWLANDPRRVYRALNTLVQRFLIGHRLLKGRVDLTGTGAGVFEMSETIVADASSATVPPLTEYPLTTTTPGVLQAIKLLKDGLDSMISDEDIAHNRIDKVVRDLVKIANTIVLKADGAVLAAVASLVTTTQAVTSGDWTTAGANPFLDIMLAKNKVIAQNLGYNPDTVVVSFNQFAYLISRAVILGNMPREQANGLIASGNMAEIAGMTYLATNNGPTNPLVADGMMLGSIAYERLGGGYQGDPTPPPANSTDANSGIETKRMREDKIDGWRYRARLVRAPMIQEPLAGCFLTGTAV